MDFQLHADETRDLQSAMRNMVIEIYASQNGCYCVIITVFMTVQITVSCCGDCTSNVT